MKITDFLAPENVMPDVKPGEKKQVLRSLAKRAAAATGLAEEEVEAAILKREELGSTGVGNGVALPHARLSGITAPFGLLARLPRAIDFEAIDDEPVDYCLPAAAPRVRQWGAAQRARLRRPRAQKR